DAVITAPNGKIISVSLRAPDIPAGVLPGRDQ
ncbi:hypothetical protein QFZ68_007422, partial [Streptomyces sp. V1I6]|nr:hypothetical protein [Streptomyces sp. V1I6]